MTIDKSLKVKRGGISTRSVLKRSERIAQMRANGNFDEETTPPIHLPKTKVVKISMKKKKKVKEEEAKK
ncbi:small basic protein [Blastopirellula marina]|uniref:Small basic protein n=1 Tax=Blastopirellula marina TaxID=124 RepID=A0A2S8GPW1_9BACT|nr:small basic protein [Blastopirellula marina]PQO46476.1 small basic protein [Blastopirellula marina]